MLLLIFTKNNPMQTIIRIAAVVLIATSFAACKKANDPNDETMMDTTSVSTPEAVNMNDTLNMPSDTVRLNGRTPAGSTTTSNTVAPGNTSSQGTGSTPDGDTGAPRP